MARGHLLNGLMLLGVSALLTACTRSESGPTGLARSLLVHSQDSDSLAPNESGAWMLEVVGGGEIELEVSSASSGALEVSLAAVDPQTGLVQEPLVRGRSAIGGGDRVEEIVVPLPETATGPWELSLAWLEGSSPLQVRSLILREARVEKRPSILFVSIDTLSARHLSLYGYERATSPNLEKLAEQSIVFEQCISNAPFTSPSYVSQFTGLYPGASYTPSEEFADGQSVQTWTVWNVPDARWTLPEMLRAAGYDTAAFVDNLFAGSLFGLRQGFNVFDETATAIPVKDPEGGIRHQLPLVFEWLDALSGEQPFFLFLQAMDPHVPYVPPGPFTDHFTGDALHVEGEVAVGSGPYVYGAIPPAAAKALKAGENTPERVRASDLVLRYDQQVRAVDHSIGELIAGLEQRGLLDDIIVIFSADHGESTDGTHEWYFNHGTVHNSVVHVPLLVRLPGAEGAGRKIRDPVQLVDLFPTMAELAGLDLESRGYLHGGSLVPALAGREVEPRPILIEGGVVGSSALLSDGWKLICFEPGAETRETMVSHPRFRQWWIERYPKLERRLNSGKGFLWGFMQRPEFREDLAEFEQFSRQPFFELYHLSEDPGELRDLSEREPERVEALFELLKRERARGLSERQQVAPGSANLSPSAEVLESLRELGYVGDD